MAGVTSTDYRVHAFRLGIEYLVSGRYAVACWFTPVGPNLLHHAVEMFLKGCLVTKLGFAGLPRGRNGHELNSLWGLLVSQYPERNLDRYGAVISELHKFEHIRYPEKLIEEGGVLAVGFPSVEQIGTDDNPKVQRYKLAVEDVDALVKELFGIGDINPEFYSFLLNQQHARVYATFINQSPLLAAAV